MKHINCLVAGGLLLLGFLMMQPPLLSRNMVKLPGTISYFNNYLDTFGAKEGDFLFYLDEILLFENMPDFGEMRAKLLQNVINPAKRRYLLPEVKMEYDKALRLTLTYKIKKILASYDKLNRYLLKIPGKTHGAVSLSLRHPQEFAVARLLMRHMGLELNRDSNRQYRLIEYHAPPPFWRCCVGRGRLKMPVSRKRKNKH